MSISTRSKYAKLLYLPFILALYPTLLSSQTAAPKVTSTLNTIAIEPADAQPVAVYKADSYFEAPNWTHDGKSLIFDQGGRIMKIPVGGGTPQPIEIGNLEKCNGSHGLSPDGTELAISCSSPDVPVSRIYIIPVNGGKPRLVTENSPCYFHGWSPDGKTIAFARAHPGGGDFWSISVKGGPETRLTTTPGVSDDPDYSPDGKYIYFNSDRGGANMQIWRIDADGKNAIQITTDERNNWTPHPSPDGKWIVFLSYPKEITGHPGNKNIQLRLMSLADKKVTKLVDLVGGNGTINVPSWSPDSKQLAYVSFEVKAAE